MTTTLRSIGALTIGAIKEPFAGASYLKGEAFTRAVPDVYDFMVTWERAFHSRTFRMGPARVTCIGERGAGRSVRWQLHLVQVRGLHGSLAGRGDLKPLADAIKERLADLVAPLELGRSALSWTLIDVVEEL
jgi:hypothetical protein